jgi:hypothetical protein
MASYDGTCWCEYNLEDDLICDSFTEAPEFTLYKMQSKNPDYTITNLPPIWNFEQTQFNLDPSKLDLEEFSIEI